jgi:hypothetical protein
MASECHSVVRAPAMRVTRLDECGVPVESACSSATTSGFVEIALTKVFQERQDALQLNANGDICVDKPKAPILRWYEANIQFCNVDPELFNIMTAEPLVLNDAADPVAIGWSTEIGSAELSNFALEFWVGTEDEGCDDGEVVYGYGVLPWMYQANLTDLTIGNQVITFTVNAITKKGSPWGVGPYNVLINETGLNAGLPGPLLTSIGANEVKRFFWTRLAPPTSQCGCMDATPLLENTPAGGVAPTMITFTIPTDVNGDPLVPGILDFGNADPNEVVTTGTPVIHNYTLAGTFTATYRLTEESGPTWTSADITIT